MSEITTATLPAGQLAALDQAIAAFREAVRMFADMTCEPGRLREAEAALRQAGHDQATGLITLPVANVHFGDVWADGSRMVAVNGSMLGGEIWVARSGRCFRFGVDARYFDAYDLVQIRAN
jgi:hypothetical protein